jgi:hypothetical protein
MHAGRSNRPKNSRGQPQLTWLDYPIQYKKVLKVFLVNDLVHQLTLNLH